jgi:hypothetical protein
VSVNAVFKTRPSALLALVAVALIGMASESWHMSWAPARQDVIQKTDGARHLAEPLQTPSLLPNRQASPRVSPRMGLVPEGEAAGLRNTFSIPSTAVLLQFPDGEFISVEFRRVPAAPPVDLALVASVQPSDANASEDGDSAFARYQAAAACLAALAGENSAMDTSSFCTQDGSFYEVARDEWLTKAADKGNVHALRVQAHENVHPDRVLELYEKMWNAGYISALGPIANLYFSRSEHGGDLQDRRIAFAHLWLQARLQGAAANGGRQLYVADLVERVRKTEEQFEPVDVEAAIQFAKGLLRQNARCCFGP